MEKYTYGGNRDAANSATAIQYTTPGDDKPQGTVYEDGGPAEIRIGDTITLSAAERDRLLPYFVLTQDGEDKGEGLIPPSSAGIDTSSQADVDKQPQSGSEDTISSKATTPAKPKN